MTEVQEVEIGWRVSSPQAALAFFPPRPLSETPDGAQVPDGLARRILEIRCPFDLRLRISPPGIVPVRFQRVPEPGGLTEAGFAGLITPIVPTAQRAKALPAVQISLNLHLVTEEDAAIHLMPPWGSPGFRDWPGSLVSGRFPLRAWPRALNAVLEWQDRDRDWVLRRGDPIAWAVLHFDDPAKVPKIVEAAPTRTLLKHLARVDNVSGVARNVGPMFEEAARRRPRRLLVARRTGIRGFGDRGEGSAG